MEYFVEESFDYKGYKCVIAMMELGHRCAYIGVDQIYRLYGLNYQELEDYISCHGGFTFSSRCECENYPLPNTGLWWFGWDYGHHNDGIDWVAYEKNFGTDKKDSRMKMMFPYENEGIVYPIEQIRKECKEVVDEIIFKLH